MILNRKFDLGKTIRNGKRKQKNRDEWKANTKTVVENSASSENRSCWLGVKIPRRAGNLNTVRAWDKTIGKIKLVKNKRVSWRRKTKRT